MMTMIIVGIEYRGIHYFQEHILKKQLFIEENI
jgi:hypothetical protein